MSEVDAMAKVSITSIAMAARAQAFREAANDVEDSRDIANQVVAAQLDHLLHRFRRQSAVAQAKAREANDDQ